MEPAFNKHYESQQTKLMIIRMHTYDDGVPSH